MQFLQSNVNKSFRISLFLLHICFVAHIWHMKVVFLQIFSTLLGRHRHLADVNLEFPYAGSKPANTPELSGPVIWSLTVDCVRITACGWWNVCVNLCLSAPWQSGEYVPAQPQANFDSRDLCVLLLCPSIGLCVFVCQSVRFPLCVTRPHICACCHGDGMLALLLAISKSLSHIEPNLVSICLFLFYQYLFLH